MRILKRLFVNIEPQPIIIFGNQKSGTSAVTHLLAECCDLSKTVDIPPSWPPTTQKLMNGKYSFKKLVSRYPEFFSTKIIKEPNLTFLSDQVIRYFPEGTFIFIVRDPRDNIRSLLNSRKIAGNLDNPVNARLNKNSSILYDPAVWGGEGENYIGVLAHRWNKAVDHYFNHQKNFRLVRYEDFRCDKRRYVEALAEALGLEIKYDISHLVDKQFQPAGNSAISYLEFFGKNNLTKIEHICGERMNKLNY